jgi:hypothetical protein
MMLALGLSYIAFIMLRNIPSTPSFQSFCRETVMDFVRGFFCIYWEDRVVFFPCFCLYAVLCLWIYVCWTILPSLEWNWFGHGVWSFWCVVEFCLPILLRIFASMFIKDVGL